MRVIIAVLLALTCGGCWGTNTIKVATAPAGARLTVNGQYVGLTPKAVPQQWAFWWGDSTSLLIEKEGYRSVEKTIQHKELSDRYWRGDKSDTSEFGLGCTYVYTFILDPVKEPAKP